MNQDLLERTLQMLSGVFENYWSGLGEVHNEISSQELSRAAAAKGPDTDWWLMPRRAKGHPRAHVSAARGGPWFSGGSSARSAMLPTPQGRR